MSLEEAAGYDVFGRIHCVDCETRELSNSVLFNPSDYGNWGDNNSVKLNKLQKLVGWCFGE